MAKKRYVQLGIGHRSMMYSEAMVERFRDNCDLVALCDTNEGRLRLRADWARQRGVEVKTYAAGDFERMIDECKPECVIVTPPDRFHDLYICRAMELGCEGVLMNTAIAQAQDPVRMARAMRLAVEAGREAFLAGRMPRKLYAASPSSPTSGLISGS